MSGNRGVQRRALDPNSVILAMVKMLHRLLGENIEIDQNLHRFVWPVKIGKIKERVDVLLTDIVLPGLDGVQLAKKLKELWPGPPGRLYVGIPRQRTGSDNRLLRLSIPREAVLS